MFKIRYNEPINVFYVHYNYNFLLFIVGDCINILFLIEYKLGGIMISI